MNTQVSIILFYVCKIKYKEHTCTRKNILEKYTKKNILDKQALVVQWYIGWWIDLRLLHC